MTVSRGSEATITRIYHSREDRVAELNDPAAQCQFVSVDEDVQRIQEAFEAFSDYVDNLDEKVADYLEVLLEDPTNDTPSRVGTTRRELIEQWTLAQATLSKLAWVLHVDGNEAYQRMMNALKHEHTVDMSGL